MNRVQRFTHDKDATLDYGWDWTNWLTIGESITTFTVSGPPGFTITNANKTGAALITAFVTASVSGLVTCHITTNFSRTDDRSIFLLVQER